MSHHERLSGKVAIVMVACVIVDGDAGVNF
jgi:hypothetical protein